MTTRQRPRVQRSRVRKENRDVGAPKHQPKYPPHGVVLLMLSLTMGFLIFREQSRDDSLVIGAERGMDERRLSSRTRRQETDFVLSIDRGSNRSKSSESQESPQHEESNKGRTNATTNFSSARWQAMTPEGMVPIEASITTLELIASEGIRRNEINRNHFCASPETGSQGGNPVKSMTAERPSIAFLFLTADKRDRNLLDDVWKAWFPPEGDERYTIWVHTKPKKRNVPLGPFLCKYAIPSVPSKYWWLLEAMIQVLKVAHRFSTASHFIYISSTSIPIQPFDRVYRQLTSSDNSCLCLSPTAHAHQTWNVTAPHLDISREHQAKADMWSALSRRHVRLLLDNESTLLEWNNVLLNYSEVPNANIGAPDEMFFATLLKQQGLFNELLETHGQITDFIPIGERAGCCTHHVSWDIVRPTDDPRNQTLTRKCSIALGNPPFHPCTYKNILARGFKEIQEEYMFLRKVWHGATFETEEGTGLTLLGGLKQFGVIA